MTCPSEAMRASGILCHSEGAGALASPARNVEYREAKAGSERCRGRELPSCCAAETHGLVCIMLTDG
eukprot:scaffold109_cov252-Pinguiococcus_pyrenoidosus.AAC.28